MKKALTLGIALCSLSAVIIQFDLMLANSTHTVFETTVRFFSYFTILTNTLVGVYFSYLTYHVFKQGKFALPHVGTLTAITVYIVIVGLVYQVLLRHVWNPTGLQKLVDEMLHSVNPVLVMGYWFICKGERVLTYRQMGGWLVYPAVYLIYVLIRGYFSGFFPYPFLDIPTLGFSQVLVNSIGMTLLFILVSTFFIWMTRLKSRSEKTVTSL